MDLSVFDMYSVGIGPSSSHTVGPMRAAHRFATGLREAGHLERVQGLGGELFGSLGLTGKGHGADRAVILGLRGETPDQVDPDAVDRMVSEVSARRVLPLLGSHDVPFDPVRHLAFRRQMHAEHPNVLTLVAWDGAGAELARRTFCSIGGGFVREVGAPVAPPAERARGPLPFRTAAELLAHCARERLPVSEVVLRNEETWRSRAEILAGLARIFGVMQACVQRGCSRDGILPGGLQVRRRAAETRRRLEADARGTSDPLIALDWVDLWALAVNEENAAGGRVVTAPTNGAAGIVPAVGHYYLRFCPGATDEGIARYLLTAGAIAMLYKWNASISGAEVGCQGEVGVACSMAAGALAEVLGGSPAQVENAAEIGMEHNLGLTCDPVKGLVQIPCIERNAMGSVKAINAARLALRGDGSHRVSLDKVIATMRRTGADMHRRYKETSKGGLAVNVTEC